MRRYLEILTSNWMGSRWSRRIRTLPPLQLALLSLALVVIYSLALPALYRVLGSAAGVMGALPVAVGAWLLGPAAGVGAAILTTGLFALRFHGDPQIDLFAAMANGCLGWLVGKIQQYGQVLHRQSTDLEQALELLQDRESLMASAQAISHTGSWEWNIAGGRVWWSEEMHRIHGTNPRSFTPSLQAALGFIHPEDRQRMTDAAARAAKSGPAEREVEYRIVRANGSMGRIRAQTEATRDADGRITKILGTAQDITDRVNLEARLLMSDRLASLGTLAGGVAHEINNPLSYVMFNLQFVAEEFAGLCSDPGSETAAELEEALEDARSGAERIRRIVQDLKSFSRSDDQPPAATELQKVIDLSAKMAATEIRPRARLVVDYQETPAVIANESRLGQVILNLLVNAAQAIPEGDAERNEIKISTRSTPEGTVRIAVSDTGCGIPPEIGNRIFDPFFTTKPVGVGTGLGLSICHGIVKSFGGDIAMHSEPNRGTTFTVTLKAAVEEPLHSPAAPATSSARTRVLIIDDEPLLGSSIKRLLGHRHDVELISDGERGLQKLLDGAAYDLVLCDLMMPGITGMDIHAQLQANRPELADQVVFMTGGAFTPRATQFIEDVQNTFLQKPVTGSQLKDLLSTRATATAALKSGPTAIAAEVGQAA